MHYRRTPVWQKAMKLAVGACRLVATLPREERFTIRPQIVRAAIGNLLRNAIENSDQGVIDIALDRSGTVTIRDPGHGLSPEQISAIYLRMARGGGEAGIGLDLIARLCDHFGWRLSLQSDAGRGTTAVLQLGAG